MIWIIIGIYLALGIIVATVAAFRVSGLFFFPQIFIFSVLAWPYIIYVIIAEETSGGGWI
jgi:hypothetical protein